MDILKLIQVQNGYFKILLIENSPKLPKINGYGVDKGLKK